MADPNEKRHGAARFSSLHEALADVAERRRKDPNWRPGFDPTYSGPASLERMTEADYAAYQNQCLRDERPVEPLAEPGPAPQPVIRACLSVGQRIRDLRRALRWTQREVAWQLGVSSRSIIRYEQGRSSPLQSRPLLALRRLESAFAHELVAADGGHIRKRN